MGGTANNTRSRLGLSPTNIVISTRTVLILCSTSPLSSSFQLARPPDAERVCRTTSGDLGRRRCRLLWLRTVSLWGQRQGSLRQVIIYLSLSLNSRPASASFPQRLGVPKNSLQQPSLFLTILRLVPVASVGQAERFLDMSSGV